MSGPALRVAVFAAGVLAAACGEDEPLEARPRSAGADGPSAPNQTYTPEEGGSDLCAAAQAKFIKCGLGSLLDNGVASCDSIDAPATDPCLIQCFAKSSCHDLGEFFCNGTASLTLETCGTECADAQVHTCEIVLPQLWVCDSHADCMDGSDEEGCAVFECDEGGMLPTAYVCNGFEDCIGGEDEADCGAGFECADGTTVVASWECDGFADCAAGEDELECGFQCENGEEVPRAFECDGVGDCTDDSDEHSGCEYFLCDYALEPQFVCSGNAECVDESDEPAGCSSTALFTCGTGEVISLDWQCDAEADCADASDELGCAPTESFDCGNGALVASAAQCDRVIDCSNGADEHENCWYRSVCN